MKQYQDKYFKRAKKENYAARSVYKLKEMQKRYRLLQPGNRVLDLGCAPGGWCRPPVTTSIPYGGTSKVPAPCSCGTSAGFRPRRAAPWTGRC